MSLKQVFIVNSDLSMGKGKIAVQVAHGEVLYMEHVLYDHFSLGAVASIDNYKQWRNETNGPIGMMKKVVLKATEQDMNNIYGQLKNGIWVCKVFDKGLTQVAENSFTCLVVEPLGEEKCEELFGHLKLL